MKLKVDHIMARHLTFWKICAMWPWEEKLRVWQRVYFLFLCFLVLFVVLSIFMYLFIADNIFDFARALNPVLISVPCIIKAILFVVHKQHVIDLLDLMNQLDNTTNTEEQQIITRATKQSKYMFLIFGFVCYSYLTLVSVTALLRTERVLLFPAVIPFHWQQSTMQYYIIAIVPQMAAVLVVLTCLTTLDTYGPTFYLKLCAYFNLLGLRLSKLGHCKDGLRKHNYSGKNQESLRDCIIYYNLCLK